MRERRRLTIRCQRMTPGIGEANTAVYDVRLWVNVNGTGWVLATADNFPAGGITVTLPYPNGTSRDVHDFFVAHMATMDINGRKAGEMEYPAVTDTRSRVCPLCDLGDFWGVWGRCYEKVAAVPAADFKVMRSAAEVLWE